MGVVQPVGLGGGGVMGSPAVSPHDPFLRFVACDMGGLYRTTDGGWNWEMVDGRQMLANTQIPVVFDRGNPAVLWAFSADRGLRRSLDRGTKWDPPLPLGSGWSVTALSIDAVGRLLLGTTNGAFYRDGGQWNPVNGAGGVQVPGQVVDFVVTADPNAPVLVATRTAIYRANATLSTWVPTTASLPFAGIQAFAGGSTTAGPINLYVAVPSSGTAGTVTGGGLYYSSDGGATWADTRNVASGLNLAQGAAGECEWPQYEHLVVAMDAGTAYVTICARRADSRNYRLYKTTNGGQTWSHVLNVDGSVPGSVPASPNVEGGWQDFSPFSWGNSGRGRGLAVGPSVAGPGAHAVLFTNNAVLYVSEDSAANWRQAYTRQDPATQTAPPAQRSWRSIGLEVTSTWNYYISEDDVGRHYICYTDVGYARSTSGGRFWNNPRPGGWNSIYELEFESAQLPSGQRTMWAAASGTHDLPYWGHFYDDPAWANNPGAVLESIDGGVTWIALGPQMIAQVISVVSQRNRPPSNRRLWAALWGEGVYRFENGAWTQKNGAAAAPLGHPGNLHVHRLQWHDNGTADGLLFCVITGIRTSASGPLAVRGGLWRSSDGGDTWTCVTTHPSVDVPSFFAREFAVDSQVASGDTIYLCTGYVGHTIPAREGSLFRTTDGGTTWTEISSLPTRLAATGYHPSWVNTFAPFVDPHKPTKVWVTTETHGLWVSEDVTAAAPTWIQYRNLPFLNPQRLRFARGNSPVIHVTSFGGGVFRLQRQVFLVVDRSAFSEWEVSSAPVVSGARPFRESVYLVFDGFLPGELGIPTGVPTTPPAGSLPQVTLRRRSDGMPPTDCSVVPSPTTPFMTELGTVPEDVAQRFTFVYDIEFTGTTGTTDFPSSGEDYIDLEATMDWLSATGAIKLFRQPNPFMLDGPAWWYSKDLGVFRVAQQSSPSDPGPFAGAPPFTGSTVANALTYLRDRLADFNAAPASGSHPFEAIPDTVLTLMPKDVANRPMFNFAIARVRFVPGTTGTTDALRVFFRTFRTQSTSMEYRAATTYRSDDNTDSPPDRIPLLGLGPQIGAGREVVGIPYFDTDRSGPGVDLRNQVEKTKFSVPGGVATEQWRFFGALLDFNQIDPRFPEVAAAATPNGPWTTNAKSLQDLIRGLHQCLIAEISYASDPIAEGATPEGSENLAQRNLAISESANPGTESSRTVHHTFHIIQTRPRLDTSPSTEDGRSIYEQEERWGAPDELMIRWIDLPEGTRARLYLNPGDADQIITLAGPLVDQDPLTRAAPDAIDCRVGDVSWVPLPRTIRPLPALLTVQLPEGVRRGEEYRVIVRQISGLTRAVVGVFELVIPVRDASELLYEEEDKLAILRSIQRSLDRTDPWVRVFARYVEQTGQRVHGFGGEPEGIPPSPSGAGESHSAPRPKP